ncbi:hypothetical protein BJY01DRAFT_8326 [Aspergillus pseudoustus]|uniref:Uncharacterized protein n=1 Tax=Aspergillus pseudoustus TaxID=1810923 RepID=A0ABR4JNI1_9EURO
MMFVMLWSREASLQRTCVPPDRRIASSNRRLRRVQFNKGIKLGRTNFPSASSAVNRFLFFSCRISSSPSPAQPEDPFYSSCAQKEKKIAPAPPHFCCVRVVITFFALCHTSESSSRRFRLVNSAVTSPPDSKTAGCVLPSLVSSSLTTLPVCSGQLLALSIILPRTEGCNRGSEKQRKRRGRRRRSTGRTTQVHLGIVRKTRTKTNRATQ